MPALSSALDPRSREFQDNVAYHRALVEELDTRLARAVAGGGDKARDKHVARGKLLARDRITALLDPGSRSEEHTSELQSLMRISYAVFCLKKKTKYDLKTHSIIALNNH